MRETLVVVEGTTKITEYEVERLRVVENMETHELKIEIWFPERKEWVDLLELLKIRHHNFYRLSKS